MLSGRVSVLGRMGGQSLLPVERGAWPGEGGREGGQHWRVGDRETGKEKRASERGSDGQEQPEPSTQQISIAHKRFPE